MDVVLVFYHLHVTLKLQHINSGVTEYLKVGVVQRDAADSWKFSVP